MDELNHCPYPSFQVLVEGCHIRSEREGLRKCDERAYGDGDGGEQSQVSMLGQRQPRAKELQYAREDRLRLREDGGEATKDRGCIRAGSKQMCLIKQGRIHCSKS